MPFDVHLITMTLSVFKSGQGNENNFQAGHIRVSPGHHTEHLKTIAMH
jgi:hypothetical protein